MNQHSPRRGFADCSVNANREVRTRDGPSWVLIPTATTLSSMD